MRSQTVTSPKLFKTKSANNSTVARAMKFFLIILCTTAVSIGHSQEVSLEKIDEFFNRIEKNNEAMGAITMAEDSKKIYERTIGYSQINGDSGQLTTMDTRYQIGSITKMFTAVMILQLVEEEKLKLDSSLEKFFPELPNAGIMSIADVLSHRSGIHDVTSDPSLRPKRTENISKEEMLKLVYQGKPDFAPGTNFSYSNSGYFVLGNLVEKVTGKPYQKVLEKKILSPLGLKNTYVKVNPLDSAKNESLSYVRLETWQEQPQTHSSILFGSGVLISTSGDLVKFMEGLFNGKLISAESLQKMIPGEKPYGLGMGSFTFAGRTFYGHTGGIDGFGSWLAYEPNDNLAVAYTANAKVYPVAQIMQGVISLYYGEPFQIPTFETVNVDPEILDRYIGVYTREGAPVKFTITRNEQTLFVQMNDQSALPLEAKAENRFHLEKMGISVEFDPEQSRMIFKKGSGTRIFTKVQ